MIKTIKKMISVFLSLTMVICLFAGCGVDQIEPQQINPIDQMIADSYVRNDEITDEMIYQLNYMLNLNSHKEEIDIVPLFDHFKIQVDNWSCVTVGISTLDEVIKTIDQANEKYVNEKTEALIAERQAAIDAEYEEAVKKAEDKGKTYDKPKKEVRTDDIHFDNPYTYGLRMGGYKGKEVEYQPTLLINPSSTKMMCLCVYKYGIPYVVFEFSAGNGRYVSKITQESEWIMNGLGAAFMESYIQTLDANTAAKAAELVDVDGRNKIAKRNIYMSGNIALGGDGFTWDSLMMLCDALELTENGRYHSFKQSSDKAFTYYTIILNTNIYERYPELISDNDVTFPSTKLVATFDPLTQVCINWTIESFSTAQTIRNKQSELGEKQSVNVHEYKVDTNDYEGMRQTISNWIDQNSVNTSTAYLAIDSTSGKTLGVVNTGIGNVDVEISIDGQVYNCVDCTLNDNGTAIGSYISADDAAKAAQMEDAEKAANYIAKHTKNLIIVCCVLDKSDDIIGKVYNGSIMLEESEETYYIASYEKTQAGFVNVRILTQDAASQLLLMYTKTYRLNADENDAIYGVFSNGGPMAVRDYINNLFAEAEAEQNKQQQEN